MLLFATEHLGSGRADLLIAFATSRAKCVGRSQVASEKADVAVKVAFQNDMTVPCAEFASDLQFGGSAYGGDGPPGLTPLCI